MKHKFSLPKAHSMINPAPSLRDNTPRSKQTIVNNSSPEQSTKHAGWGWIKRREHYLLIGVFCIFIDQILKHIARLFDTATLYIIPQIFGWEYYENPGIAFGIPIPHIIIIPLTIIIISAGIRYANQSSRTNIELLGTTLIIAGALSNLIDRISYGVTIDYIRILTSIINIADICIILGVYFLIKKQTRPTQTHI